MNWMPASVTPGEILIDVYQPRPDGEGRVSFFAYWHDPCTLSEGGPPDHVRGQVFCTRLDEFTARHEARGGTISIRE